MMRLYFSLLPGFWRALWAPWTTPFPLGCYPPPADPDWRPGCGHGRFYLVDTGEVFCTDCMEFRPGPQRRERHPAMTAPIERASDWDPERRSAEVIEFRREGRL